MGFFGATALRGRTKARREELRRRPRVPHRLASASTASSISPAYYTGRGRSAARCRSARRPARAPAARVIPCRPASAQAAPDESATRPPRDRISVSASARAMETWRLPGSRGASAPFTSMPSTRAAQAREQAVAEARAMRCGLARGERFARPARAAAPKPTMPGTLSVPERSPFSCPPPSFCGLQAQPGPARLAHVERAHALGAVHLVRGEAHEVGAPGLHVHRDAADAPARRRCGTRCPARGRPRPLPPPAARCRPRCWRPSPRRGTCPDAGAAITAPAVDEPVRAHRRPA